MKIKKYLKTAHKLMEISRFMQDDFDSLAHEIIDSINIKYSAIVKMGNR